MPTMKSTRRVLNKVFIHERAKEILFSIKAMKKARSDANKIGNKGIVINKGKTRKKKNGFWIPYRRKATSKIKIVVKNSKI